MLFAAGRPAQRVASTHGREDGENDNFGLVDIHDQRYNDLTAMFVSLPAERLKGVENLSGLNLNVRNVAAMELPARCLGRERFQAGDRVELDCTLITHCGAYRVDWKGTFTLRE